MIVLNPILVEQVKDKLASGKTASDVSFECGLSYSTVLRIKKDKRPSAMSYTERKAVSALRVIQEEVDRQSNDEAIWAEPYGRKRTIHEALLLTELRALHDVIERFTIQMFEKIRLVDD